MRQIIMAFPIPVELERGLILSDPVLLPYLSVLRLVCKAWSTLPSSSLRTLLIAICTGRDESGLELLKKLRLKYIPEYYGELVVKSGRLDVLLELERKGSPLTSCHIMHAARQGNFWLLKYLLSRDLPHNQVCLNAALEGKSLECIKLFGDDYLWSISLVAKSGSLEVLESELAQRHNRPGKLMDETKLPVDPVRQEVLRFGTLPMAKHYFEVNPSLSVGVPGRIHDQEVYRWFLREIFFKQENPRNAIVRDWPCINAAMLGDIEMLETLHNDGYPLAVGALLEAVVADQLEVVLWLEERLSQSLSPRYLFHFARGRCLPYLIDKYINQQNCEILADSTLDLVESRDIEGIRLCLQTLDRFKYPLPLRPRLGIVFNGDLEILKLLHSSNRLELTSEMVLEAALVEQPLRFLLWFEELGMNIREKDLLEVLAKRGHTEVLEYLVPRNFKTTWPIPVWRAVAASGYLSTLKWMIDHNAEYDVSTIQLDEMVTLALWEAAGKGAQLHILDYLLSLGIKLLPIETGDRFLRRWNRERLEPSQAKISQEKCLIQ